MYKYKVCNQCGKKTRSQQKVWSNGRYWLLCRKCKAKHYAERRKK